MPKFPKPFFRAGRGWYVQVGKQQIKLADGPENKQTEAAAIKRYHEVMAENGRDKSATPAKSTSGLSVVEVFEKYLDWCQRNRSARSFEWYRKHIQRFLDFLPRQTMPALDLRAYNIVEWTDKHPTWGANQRRGCIVALTRPFNWAAKLGYIESSPVRGVEKPKAEKRNSKLTPEDFTSLIELVKPADPFHDLLTFAWETGCRPQEARHIEPRHLRLDLHRIEIPPSEAKGKQRWRVIYLSPIAEGIVRRLLANNVGGKLFRNKRSRPWKVCAVNCRFGRLKQKLGTRFAAYDLRHAFATRKLKEGFDPITVASLLGHKDATMLCKHYEGISGDGKHLLNAVT